MQGTKRPLPSPEGDLGETSRPRKRWRTLQIAMREELCLRENLGRRETGTVCFRRLLMVRLVSMVKRVVPEEVERVLSFLHAPAPRMMPSEKNHPTIQLKFLDKVNQPVHTSFNVERQNPQPRDAGLRIAIYSNNVKITRGPLASAEIEVLALHSDFCKNGRDNWSREDFENGILVNRDNKPPVLLEKHALKLENGEATIDRLVFGDNSSWTRDKMFRLGIRVLNRGGERVKEGITEPFPVRDRRMEACRKHYPPVLSDEIWRLEGIAKNGDRHKSLHQNNIYTVKDLLESYSWNEVGLRTILGGISETSRSWKKIIGHAKTCADLGDYNGVLDQSNQFSEIPSNHTYRHGSSSSQQHPLENQIINEDEIIPRVLEQLSPLEGYNSGNLLDHEVHHNMVDHTMECDNEFQATYNALNNTGLPQQVSVDEQINSVNPNIHQSYLDLLNGDTSWVLSPLEEVQHGRISNQDQFCISSEALADTPGRIVPLGTNAGSLIVGSGSSVPDPCENNLINPDSTILNVGPMQHPIVGGLQVEIPIVDLDLMEDLFANMESSPNNIYEFPVRSNSFDACSFGELIEGFKANLCNNGDVGPHSPRKKAKIKLLFKLIAFLVGPRRRARTRIVPPGNQIQTLLLNC